jgi:hypothetical protein
MAPMYVVLSGVNMVQFESHMVSVLPIHAYVTTSASVLPVYVRLPAYMYINLCAASMITSVSVPPVHSYQSAVCCHYMYICQLIGTTVGVLAVVLLHQLVCYRYMYNN